MKVSIGPILFFWPKQKVYDFYTQMLNTSVDAIYLGETICSKRRELSTAQWLELAQHLAESGKEVVISSLALLMAESELSSLRTICEKSPVKVEANDMSAVQILSEMNLPFVCGPSINIYNARTLGVLHKKGAIRWVMPVELSGHCLETILQQAQEMAYADKIETEVFSYGHLPLAYSARCFTARHLDLPKDQCKFSCIDYPEGILVRSQEQQNLFNLNGIQTQSSDIYNLFAQKTEMQAMGVDMMRISPVEKGTEKIVEHFKSDTPDDKKMIPLSNEFCNGYWYAKPGMESVPFESSSLELN